MRTMKMTLVLAPAALMLVACSGNGDRRALVGATGSAGGTAGAGTAGSAGTAGAGTAGSGAAGSGTSGTTGAAGGAAGSSGSAGVGGAGTTGSAGMATDGGAGSSAHVDAAHAERDPDSGPVTTAGCANHNYQLCIDFENGIDTATWTGGTAGAIVTDEVAHGKYAYHLFASGAGKGAVPKMTAGRLLSTKVGTIKNQVWTRFYVHFSPGAPGGHGNMVAAYDENNNWYEMGWQFDGMMGVWHGNGGELPLRSMPLIRDQWYCVEAYFDGAAAVQGRWWIDGTEAAYYMNGGGPKISPTTQFKRLEAGFTPYAGLELKMPDGKGDQTETRVLQDTWIDDIAFDTQRIGCIE